MLRVILIDDERLALQALRQLLADFPDVRIVGETGCATTAADLIRSEKPDAIFLDIQMPCEDGFEVLRGLEAAPKVVFVTAHSEHAVRAFEVDAVDYLLKPVRPERLAEAIQRLEAACSPDGADGVGYRPGDRICLRTPERTVVAALADLVALEADGDFSRIYISEETPLLICQPLGHYEKTLPNPPFVRLDRSLMINLERIAKIDHVSRDETRLRMHGLAEPFVLGRKAGSRLKQSIDARLLTSAPTGQP